MQKSLKFLMIFVLILIISNSFFINAQNDVGLDGSSDEKNDATEESNWFTDSLTFIKEKTSIVLEPPLKALKGSVEKIIGVRKWYDIFYFFLQGFFATLIVWFFIFILIRSSILGTSDDRPFLIRFIDQGGAYSALIIGFIYTILMFIPVINRFFEIITLQIFAFLLDFIAEFILRTFMLSIFLLLISIAPAIAHQLYKMRETARRIKVVNDARIAIAAQKAMAKELRRGI